MKLDEFRRVHGCLHCEVCISPARGCCADRTVAASVFEVHHTSPLASTTTPRSTTLADLAVVGASGHRASRARSGVDENLRAVEGGVEASPIALAERLRRRLDSSFIHGACGKARRPARSHESGPGATINSMIDRSSCKALERDPERASGAWVLRGSRVSVAALFENPGDGVPVGGFVEFAPGVALGQARPVLEHAARSALAAA
jgi:uncharacterized protein (DUF433 family)